MSDEDEMSDGIGEEEGEEGEEREGGEVSISHFYFFFVSHYIKNILPDSRQPADNGGCGSGLITPLQDRHGAGPRLCSHGPTRQVCWLM